MIANEMTFGVEIETTIPAGRLAVGCHGHGRPIAELPGWKADRDPSIRATVSGHEACEFVSPVYKGTSGLIQLLADLQKIKAMGAAVNETCGLHIHVGFDKSNREELDRLVTLVSNFEKAIYASTGTKKREQGRWCGGLNRYGNAETARRNGNGDRYHVLNICTGDKPTVEFRAFGATLNPTKLLTYVRMVVGLVERAKLAKRNTNWTAKQPKETSPIHRGGEGQTALTRLFYQLGWTKGRQKEIYGNLVADSLPDLKRSKKELIRLAKKYDGVETARRARRPVAPITMAVGSSVRVEEGPYAGQTGTVIEVFLATDQRGVAFENDTTRHVIPVVYLRSVAI